MLRKMNKNAPPTEANENGSFLGLTNAARKIREVVSCLSLRAFVMMPIGKKITMMYGCVFCVVVLVVNLFLFFNIRSFYYSVLRNELSNIADTVVAMVHEKGSVDNDVLSRLTLNKKIDVSILFVGKDDPGRQIIRAPRINISITEGNGYNRPMFVRDYVVQEKFSYFGDDVFVVHAARVDFNEGLVTGVMINLFVMLGTIGFSFSFWGAARISRMTLRPIKAIAQTAERISIEDLSQRIFIDDRKDEITDLAVTFNNMIERLDASFTKQNQFISDASHELRTPVSVIQGYANLIDRWGKDDPAVLQEAIDSIKSQTQHMTTLINKLLFFANEEKNKAHIQKVHVSLNSIVTDVIKETSVLNVNQQIFFDERANVYVYGDINLIKQLLWIFIENSIKYSGKEEGVIVIAASLDYGRPMLSVKDNGIGISQEDLPYVFERFYRGDKSRNKRTPGTGLGLSIAHWIIKQHNATYTIESKLGEGTEIKVFFPRQ